MKTWRDFNVRAIRRLLDTHGGEPDVSDARFARIMDAVVDDLSVRVPCLTCGVNYPLNACDHTCQPEDVWINAYVHSVRGSVVRRTGYQPNVVRLREKYPLLDTHRLVFRGLHFATESAFAAFAKALGDNVYRVSTVTSWTTDSARAAQFACFMLPGGHDEALRRREILRMIDERADMTGAYGVVLALLVTPDQVLCDIADVGVGGFDESEVIVLPGTYDVSLHCIFVRHPGTTDWPQPVDRQITAALS